MLTLVKEGKYKEIEDEVNKIREEVSNTEDDMQQAQNIYLKRVKHGELSGYISEKLSGYISGHEYFWLEK